MKNEGIKVLSCGKVITPQIASLDSQLDLLYERGTANGAKISFINESEFYKLVPDGNTSSGRALWVSDTCVVKPKQIVESLSNKLITAGIEIFLDKEAIEFQPEKKTFSLNKNQTIKIKGSNSL